ANAWENGYFEKSIVPVKDINGITLLDRDEHMRPGSTVESLSKLNPAFAKLAAQAGFDEVALQKYHWIEEIDHVHTAANSSGIVDGASLVIPRSKSIVPVKDINGITRLDRDEHMRPGSTVESLSKLNPAFAKLAAQAGFDEVALQKYHWIEEIDHVHTAANSSGIVDGASLVIL